MRIQKIPFSELSKKEKKDFLSNEMIKRMIGIEQRVCVRFRRPVRYNETEYYKSLSPVQKKSFHKYLRLEKIKKIVSGIFFFSMLFLLVFINTNITGDIVSIPSPEKTGISFFLALLVIFFIILAILNFNEKMWKKSRFSEHEKILENLLYKVKNKKE
jgi:hypothetical protein